jgi:hypothetical protein
MITPMYASRVKDAPVYHAQRLQQRLEERRRHHVHEKERDRDHEPDLLLLLLAD